MTEYFDLAILSRRDSGTYAEPENCLSCDELVDASLPHIFVRDADESYPDEDALIGLLHTHCEEAYIEAAKKLGVSVPGEILDEMKRTPTPSREEVLEAGGNLELQYESGNGYRHYLNQEAVHAGTTLEVLTVLDGNLVATNGALTQTAQRF